MSGDVSKVVAFLQEHAKYVDVRDKPMVFRAAELLAKLDAVTKERDALRSALNPQQWTSEMSTAWHLNIPDLQKSFDELTNAALTDQGRAGEGA